VGAAGNSRSQGQRGLRIWQPPRLQTEARLAAPGARRRYFTARKSLPKQYWTGVERRGTLYAFADLSYLPQAASNDPYAHWCAPPSSGWTASRCPRRRAAAAEAPASSRGPHAAAPGALFRPTPWPPGAPPRPTPCRSWVHSSARKVVGADCVLAFSAGAYDLYLGDASAAALSNSSFFHPGPAGLKYGWSGAPCLTPAQAVCEVAAGSFVCPPPPSAPTSPDTPSPAPPPLVPPGEACKHPCPVLPCLLAPKGRPPEEGLPGAPCRVHTLHTCRAGCPAALLPCPAAWCLLLGQAGSVAVPSTVMQRWLGIAVRRKWAAG
jgi:hypothetical protein